MPTYEISVRCKDCGRDHPVLLRIYVEDGPSHKRSIAESFPRGSLPPQVAAVRGHRAVCCKTGRKFQLENDEDIFLVPPAQFKRDSITR